MHFFIPNLNERVIFINEKELNTNKNYTVYMHVFPNDKVYIGITSRTVEERWMSNGVGYKVQPRMWRAIQKYGWNNIEHIVVATKLDSYTAKQMEINLIELYNSANKEHGYNVSLGGDVVSENTKRLMSEKATGRKFSEETRYKLSESLKGRKPSAKAIEHIKHYNATRDYSQMNMPTKQSVMQFDVITGELVNTYRSINLAAHENNLDVRNLAGCVRGEVYRIGKYFWIRESDYTFELYNERKYLAQNPDRNFPIEVTDIDTNETKIYETNAKFCKEYGFRCSTINAVLRSKSKIYKNKYKVRKMTIPEYYESVC